MSTSSTLRSNEILLFKTCSGVYPYSTYDIRESDMDRMDEPKQGKHMSLVSDQKNDDFKKPTNGLIFKTLEEMS